MRNNGNVPMQVRAAWPSIQQLSQSIPHASNSKANVNFLQIKQQPLSKKEKKIIVAQRQIVKNNSYSTEEIPSPDKTMKPLNLNLVETSKI